MPGSRNRPILVTSDHSGAEAAARLRRLHHLQVVGLSVATVILVIAGVYFFSVTNKVDTEKRIISDTAYYLSKTFDNLRTYQSDLDQAGRSPQAGLSLLMDAVRQRKELVSSAEATADYVDDDTRSVANRTVELYDKVLEIGSTAIRDGTDHDEFVEVVTPYIEELTANSQAWTSALREHRVKLNRDSAVLLNRARTVAIVVAISLTMAGLVTWWLIGRERERVVSRLRFTMREQDAMREIATSATWASGSSDVHKVGVHEIAKLLGARLVTITPQGAVAGQESVSTAQDLTDDEKKLIAKAEDAALSRTEPAVVHCEESPRVAMCVPYQGVSNSWSHVTVLWNDASDTPNNAMNVLGRVCASLDLATQGAASRELLALQAVTDTLTGLPNHRAFQENLADEVNKAISNDQHLALIMVDVDAFSNVNDAYGHEEGDRVLSELGMRLRSLSRENDMVARVGGEEFAWLMPGVAASGAYAAAERARVAVRSKSLGLANQLTISAGVVDLTHAQNPQELLRLADSALRQAKAGGQDATAIYRPGVSEHSNSRFGHLQSLSALRALARAVDLRDDNTQRHSERVAALSHQLALELGWSPANAIRLRDAALVHDVGKVGVPDAILLKPGALTDEEYAVIKTHPALGAQIVSEILDEEQVDWVRGHHERVDGRGYPDGRSEANLSDGARIIATADTWDAMTSDRPYRAALSREKAMSICVEVAGTQLDHDVVAALARLYHAGASETQGHDQRTGLHHRTPGVGDVEETERNHL